MANRAIEIPLTFTDLFGGIGGFHIAAANLGMQCIFACDIDAEAQQAYQRNFGAEPAGDITKIPSDSIPQPWYFADRLHLPAVQHHRGICVALMMTAVT